MLTVRGRNRLCAAVHMQLPEDVLDMHADCLRADREALGDARLIETVREEAEDLELAGRQVAGTGGRRLLVGCYAALERPDACQEHVDKGGTFSVVITLA